MDKQKVIFKDLGIIDYKTAWDYQESLLQDNVNIKSAIRNLQITESGDMPVSDLATQNYFLFCEHPPVYTLGKSGKKEHVLMSDDQLAANDISYFNTNRGGDITFHGLQQIVGYPILDLEKFGTDIGKYLRNLEEVIILTIAEYGIKGGRSKGETGVWIDEDIPGKERKICAIGVRCSRWVTMHGFAFNVNVDLNYFKNIVPCGIDDKDVTSMQRELGYALDMEEVKAKLKNHIASLFKMDLV